MLAALFALACSPSPEELRAAVDAVCEPRKSELDARADALVALGSQAQALSLEAITAPTLDGKLHFDSSTVDAGKRANVVVASIEDLAVTDPFESSKAVVLFSWHLRAAREVRANGCATLVHFGPGMTVEMASTQAREGVEGALAPTWLVAMRRSGGAAAEVTSLNPEGFKAPEPGVERAPMGQFSSGEWTGYALVYRIADQAFLGGVPVTARSSATIEITGSPDPLRDDLTRNLARATTKALLPYSDDLREPEFKF